MGLRKLEAKLLQQGFSRDDVIVAHPNYLDKAVGTETKVIGVKVFDPLGMGPVTSTFKNFLEKKESYNVNKFRELIEK